MQEADPDPDPDPDADATTGQKDPAGHGVQAAELPDAIGDVVPEGQQLHVAAAADDHVPTGH